MQQGLMGLPQDELQWFMSAAQNGGPAAASPGLAAIQGPDAEQYCSAGGEHMAPALLAVKSVSFTDYTATGNCHVEHEGESCNFPNIRAGCCDVLRIGASCGNDQGCMQQGLMGLPQDELQWFMSAAQNGGPAAACPGLAAIQGPEAEQYCSAGGEHMAPVLLSATSGKMQLWIALAQLPTPEVQSSWVLGLLGFIAGAAVVTAVVAFKKKKHTASELYAPLAESSA